MTPLQTARAALEKAEKKFLFYAEQHAAKGTADADIKALVNTQMASDMREALAAIDAAQPPVEKLARVLQPALRGALAGMFMRFKPAAEAAVAAHIADAILASDWLREVRGEWRTDMENAPQGQANSVIIAVTGGGRDPVVGEAYFDPVAYGGTWWWAGTSKDEYFDNPVEEIMHGRPTHWRPLQAPPASAEGEG